MKRVGDIKTSSNTSWPDRSCAFGRAKLLGLGLFALLATGCAAHRPSVSGLFEREGADRNESKTPAERLADAEQLAEGGKLVDARREFERLIVDAPERWEAYHGLGRVADRQRKHREAQALYAEAIRLHSGDAELFNNLGYSFYLDGQLEKAASAMLKAVSLSPATQRYRNNLGLVYGAQRNDAAALEEFRRAGSEADAQYNMAFVMASRDEVAAAKACFERALAINPAFEPARRALRAFEQYEKDPARADVLLADDDREWVPFVEGAAAAAQAATGDVAKTTETPAPQLAVPTNNTASVSATANMSGARR